MLTPSVCTLQVQRMIVLTWMLTSCGCTLQVQRMIVLTWMLTSSVCTLQVQRMIVLTWMLTSCGCTLQVQRMVDEYKGTNSHILKQCMRISEMLLINIPVGKLFEGLDFANEQVESLLLLLLLPLAVAASTVLGSLLLLCIICGFSCLWPQGLLLMKDGCRISDLCNSLVKDGCRISDLCNSLVKDGCRISDLCNSLVHAVHVKVRLALVSLDEHWLRRTEKWFFFYFAGKNWTLVL